MKYHLLVICILLVMLVGCAEENIIEDLGIVTVYGFDKDEDTGHLLATTVLYQFDPDITNASQIINSEGDTLQGVKRNANKESGHKITNGQLRVILFGPSLSKEDGFIEHLDTLGRDAKLSDIVYIAVSDQPSDQVLASTNYEEAPNIGAYLHQLIETAVRNEEITSSTYHEYLRDYFQVGRDPVLPLLSVDSEKVTIKNIAALQDDKVVGDFTIEEGFYIRLMVDQFDSGLIELKLPIEPFEDHLEEYAEIEDPHIYAVIDKINSNTDITMESKNPPSFEVKIDIDGRVIELSRQLNLDDPETLDVLETQVTKQMEKELEEVINKAQEMNADVFGFGVKYNNNTRGEDLTKEQWREMFTDIEVETTIKINIERHGTVQ
ncbi:Ger(x)C family spore germination protein [Alkalibacillus aidingensis]|uniref:Ger(x)C family spore germination protein n=1 Tax=Alkalibacillus aidingensis TaxID=2747607 RepID=UPI0016606F66|nr:Ger(x)C family spore germination protein [Alkalibacillus aidingensis]